MKATLTFNLPEDEDYFNVASKGKELYFVLSDMDNWLRAQIKHHNKDYQEVRDELHNLLDNWGVNLEMMR